MGIFHFTDGHNAQIILSDSIGHANSSNPNNNQPVNTDTQVKDFN